MRIKESTAVEIRRHFAEIRQAITKTHDSIDAIIDRAVNQNSRNAHKYNAEYLATKTAELRAQAAEDAAAVKNEGIQTIRQEFAGIELCLRDWLFAPVPDGLASALRIVKDFDITLGAQELAVLSESAYGSYLGLKLIDGMAQQHGIKTPFIPYHDIERQLGTAKRDCITAINAYVGQLSFDNTFVANKLSLPLAPEEMSLYHVFAQDFEDPERATSLREIEAGLCDLTEDDFAITPARRNEIDKIFEDENEEERITTAARLIDSEDPLGALLPLYDQSLYKNACNRLDTVARERALRALSARDAAETTLGDVVKALAKGAQRKAAIENER